MNIPDDVKSEVMSPYIPLEVFYSLGVEGLPILISESKRRTALDSLEAFEVALKYDDQDMFTAMSTIRPIRITDYDSALIEGYPHLVRYMIENYPIDITDNSEYLVELMLSHPDVFLDHSNLSQVYQQIGILASEVDKKLGITLITLAYEKLGSLNEDMFIPILISHLMEEEDEDPYTVMGRALEVWEHLSMKDDPIKSLEHLVCF